MSKNRNKRGRELVDMCNKRNYNESKFLTKGHGQGNLTIISFLLIRLLRSSLFFIIYVSITRFIDFTLYLDLPTYQS